MAMNKEIETVREVLQQLRESGKVRVAVLYGSFAGGTPHARSDIDLALYLSSMSEQEEIAVLDEVLMAVERQVSILRLDDDEESPFVVQQALKGVHLIEPDSEVLYAVQHRVLHQAEEIRFRKELKSGQAARLLQFLEETIDYFARKTEGVDRDRYFADRDIRNILDKTINDMILCVVDICELCLRRKQRTVPDTYKDTVLACYELLGDIVLKIAPLVKHRNETIHQYLKVNWQNIVTVRARTADIEEFLERARTFFMAGE